VQAEEVRMVAPVAAEVSVGYGWNYSLTHEDWRFHPGLDYAVPEGSPVRAAAGGLVARVSEDRQWGWQVVLSHDEGLETRYMGLGLARVKEGQEVKAGQVLGEVGAPGLAEVGQGPHLHFEVRVQGEPRDPQTLFR
jgi:murein DD-endopeptidase MepM/ murein hydrolase activator NlpD